MVPSNAYSALPELAQQKLRAMQEQQDEDHIAVNVLIDREMEVRAARAASQNRFTRLMGEPLGGPLPEGKSPAEHPALVQLQGEIERADDEIERIKERQRVIEARRTRCLVNCTRYAATLTGREVLEHDGDVTVPLGIDTVLKLRDHIKLLRAEASAIEERPPHSDAVREMLTAQIRKMARLGEPDVLRSLELGRPLRFPTYKITDVLAGFVQLPDGTQPQSRTFTHFDIPDITGLYLFFEQDKIIKWIDKQILHLADDERALTPVQRAAELQRIAGEVLDCERAEESIIWRDQLSGVRVHRRADADARAVLGLVSELPVPTGR
jgi:hypothetical protein